MLGVLLCAGGTASAALPDGRAWEMVTPLDKNGGDIVGIDGDNAGGVVQASADGEGVTYVSSASFGEPQGASVGSQYVSTRHGEAGWLTQNISTPTDAQTYPLGGGGTPYSAFSSDLSRGLMYGGARRGGGAFPVESPPLAGAPAGYENYYLNDVPAGVLQPLLTSAPSLLPEDFELRVQGVTPDLSHVVLTSPAALGGGAVEEGGNSNLYEWERATGLFQPVNFLPNGVPAPGANLLLGGSGGSTGHAISDDGSRVVWTRGPDLYVREGIGTEQARTVQADAPLGDGRFLTASSDGSRVFFADNNRLTADSTANGGGFGDLYMFEPASERLTDLTVDHEGGSAEVQGVLGVSEDGSYVYFVANGVLAPGASLGSCEVGAIQPGAICNLYLWHEGTTRFIDSLAGGDNERSVFNALGVAFDWTANVAVRTARVSREGTRLVFMSSRSLTEYDNTVREGTSCGKNSSGQLLPAQCEEVFLYEASPKRLSCVSCNPSGARPEGPSGIPGGTEFSHLQAMYQSRALSEGVVGNRVLFSSVDALVPQDTNGAEDVYEYENGHVYLLSDGRSAAGAAFVDASANGDDVYFVTRARLAGQDTDQLVDVYDARAPHAPGEKVGFPVSPPLACEGEDCRPAGPPAPAFALPSSAAYAGLGNAPSAASKLVKRTPKKAKPKKRKKEARHAKKARTRTVGKSTRGGR